MEKLFYGNENHCKSLGTYFQVSNETRIRENHAFKTENYELQVKRYPKRKNQILKNLKELACPSCKQKIWIGFDPG